LEKRQKIIMMNAILNRMVNILFRPREEWQVIKDEPVTYSKLLLQYVAPLAAIPPLAVIISAFLLNGHLSKNNVLVHLLITNLLWYCMYVLNVVVVGVVITAIVTSRDALWTGVQGFKIAAYSFTPLFAAGCIAVFPRLGWIVDVAILYSIYLLYLGIVGSAGTSKNRSVWYTAASFLAAAVLVGVMNVGEYFLESLVVNKFVL
jgi:hypothetical protein